MGEPSSQDAAPPLQDAAPPTLFQEIMAQWEWLQQAHDYVVAMPALRERVSSFRKSAWEFTSTAKVSTETVERQVTATLQPSDASKEHWAALLAFRRQYPAVIVAAATGVSVLPALAHLRTSKLTALRLVARNSLLGGGGAAVLLYPEIVFRAAPYVSRGVTKAEDTIASVRAN
mmetsp:Transcript_26783/g.79928  ORF Transcript_26783/g.79928 Transcript_26783/m.79928 type:complete len:174 (+) Transcript_26783:73-594(+)